MTFEECSIRPLATHFRVGPGVGTLALLLFRVFPSDPASAQQEMRKEAFSSPEGPSCRVRRSRPTCGSSVLRIFVKQQTISGHQHAVTGPEPTWLGTPCCPVWLLRQVPGSPATGHLGHSPGGCQCRVWGTPYLPHVTSLASRTLQCSRRFGLFMCSLNIKIISLITLCTFSPGKKIPFLPESCQYSNSSLKNTFPTDA